MGPHGLIRALSTGNRKTYLRSAAIAGGAGEGGEAVVTLAGSCSFVLRSLRLAGHSGRVQWRGGDGQQPPRILFGSCACLKRVLGAAGMSWALGRCTQCAARSATNPPPTFPVPWQRSRVEAPCYGLRRLPLYRSMAWSSRVPETWGLGYCRVSRTRSDSLALQ